jgi:alpha-N-arabinofuranosidase
VKYWGVGNESWGCGGEFTPEEYAGEYRRYQAWLPRYGVDLKLVASGPNQDDVDWTTRFFENIFTPGRGVRPPFGWSMHYYTDLPHALKFAPEDVYPGYELANRMEKIMLDHWTAMGVYDREHVVKLVVDEYGPWYRFSDSRVDPTHVLGQQLTVRDAIMTALTLDTFNRHPDKVGIAACAQLINCIDSLFLSHEEHFITTPVFHVFDMYKWHQGGQALRTQFSAPDITFPRTAVRKALSSVGDEATVGGPQSRFWGLNGSASLSGKTLTLTVVNPHLTEARDTQILLRGNASVASVDAEVLGGEDVHNHNTFEQPDAVVTKKATATVSGKAVRLTLPPSSVTRLAIVLS